jgi:4-hydroxy-tetrahydrodipicolinate synthase
MKNKNPLSGTGVAIITPFDINGYVDVEALKILVQHQIKGQTDVLVVLGTTGETATLSEQEKELVVNTVISENAGNCRIVLGVGGNNTAALVSQLKEFKYSGVDGILSVSPYYNKPTQEGIFQHYKALSEASPLPIILYNVPGRTGSNMLASTTLRIAKACKNVVGIKEASGNLEQVMDILNHRHSDFFVLSGDDPLTLPILACGGDGVISVTANAFPAHCSQMVNAFLTGDIQTARKIHFQLLEITKLFFVDGNPAGIKYALQLLNICKDFVRLPLVGIREETKRAIEKELEELRIKN